MGIVFEQLIVSYIYFSSVFRSKQNESHESERSCHNKRFSDAQFDKYFYQRSFAPKKKSAMFGLIVSGRLVNLYKLNWITVWVIHLFIVYIRYKPIFSLSVRANF